MLATSAAAQERPSPPRAGITFQSTETQALQADDTRNPGMLWVEQGAKLWSTPAGADGKSCTSCHGNATVSMKGVAARYPQVGGKPTVDNHHAVGVFNLEDFLRSHLSHLGRPEPAYESQELLALTAYIAHQSRGLARKLFVEPDVRADWTERFEHGRKLYVTRQGQMNLACNQCHDDLVGKKLRGDTISQAQTHGWPAYRLEWQTMGSLQRRLRACSLGVRAEVLDYGHPDYLALELYLAWRGEGLPLESPGVRR